MTGLAFSSRRLSQRGVTMIEAMVALLVMSLGMVALAGVMSNLRQNADIAKQRSEAMRIAQSELAKLRSFSVLDKAGDRAARDYDNDLLAAVDPRIVTVENSNATFVLKRNVDPITEDGSDVQAHSVAVSVGWKNRHGEDETLRLDTVIAKIEPVFSAALSIAPPNNGARASDGRHPVIPVTSRNMGDGSSVFRPSAIGSAVWVFNNASGLITGTCQIAANVALPSLTPRDLESCNTTATGYLVAGTIQFSFIRPANSTTPNGAARALSVYVSLMPSQYKARNSAGAFALVPGGDYPASPSTECFTETPGGATRSQTFVNYNCIVFPNAQTPRNWWGQVLLRDLDIGTAATQFRVCRYSADYNGNGYTYRVVNDAHGTFNVDNEEHPDIYRGVSYSLSKQNFLVVRGDVPCPSAPAVDLAHGVFVDYSTIQIQPSAQSSP